MDFALTIECTTSDPFPSSGVEIGLDFTQHAWLVANTRMQIHTAFHCRETFIAPRPSVGEFCILILTASFFGKVDSI